MADEIGDQLQDNGVVTIADLAKTYDLPGDFISQVIFIITVIEGLALKLHLIVTCLLTLFKIVFFCI